MSRTVHLHVHEQLTQLTGQWRWEAGSDAVFCSDVMMPFPTSFEGTRGIIHPDDVDAISKKINGAGDGPISTLSFRIITTYGKLLLLEGYDLQQEPAPEDLELKTPELEWMAMAAARDGIQEISRTTQLQSAGMLTELRSSSASWYANASTHEVGYSDNHFRLHGLLPQSLNAHLKTFASFIHPDDAAIVEEYFVEAWRRRIPFEIVYRILPANGGMRWLRLSTEWVFNEVGEQVMLAAVQDETPVRDLEERFESFAAESQVRHELLRLSERSGSLGSWQYDLLTKKWSFSENFYRIHGLRAHETFPGRDLLFQFVHPSDRERVEEAFRKMESEHECPEIDYRILRADGQMRHLRLSGRTLTHLRTSLLIVGVLRDASLERAHERRALRLGAQVSRGEAVLREVESAGGLCTWTQDLRRHTSQWSEGCHALLGFKPNNLELSQKLFQSFLHVDDRKKFTDTLETVLQVRTDTTIPLRIVVKGITRHLEARFKTITQETESYLVVIFHDETPVLLANSEKTVQERLLKELLAAVPENVLVTDRQNFVLHVNKSLTDKSTGREGPPEGKHLFDVFPKLKEGDFTVHLDKALEGVPVFLPSVSLHRHRGGTAYSLIPVRDESGTVVRVLHVQQERPPAQELQQQIVVQQHLAEQLAEASDACIFVLDRHMNYIYWNNACSKAAGIKRSEVIGRNILEVDPAFYDDTIYLEFRRALKGETITVPSGDGNSFIKLIPVFDDDGRVSCIVWVAPNGHPVPAHQ
jgi:PAS domain S-box-containing protein